MSTRILSSSTTGANPAATPTGAGARSAGKEQSASSQGSGDPATPSDDKLPRHSVGRAIGIAVFAAAIVSAILLAFSWPTVTADPKDLPIAAVGDEKQIDQVVDNAPDGMLDLKDADSRADAVDMIKHRDVYGALVLGDEPEILVSSAASPAVAQQLRSMAAQMQQQIDKQAISGMQDGLDKLQGALKAASQAPATGQPGAGQAPPAAGDGQDVSATEVPQIKVTDVAPLSDDDSTGAGLAIAGLPLTIGGIIGGVLTSMLVHSRRMRAVAVVVYGAVGGLALTLILQSWFGILQGNFGLNVLAAGLAVASTAALINGFVSLLGSSGIAIGAILTMFIGNPISSLQQPKEFLAGSWGDIGQFFVPGAAGTLLRDLSYFPDAAMATQWWVLVGWFALGIALILIGHVLAHRKKRAAAH
ncbi:MULTISPECIES: ABC transporter permease [unclassified Brevibacterium]|uniref:ABC transporter permease n=1 Tax=unclassified Brevibacterium TaxID=2614124 RepID=UPI001092DE66|nr:ABC transporter permease [Brevibacterium sp. S22]TGD33231.1 ABC transporter permease [Brevibacterium sp. S22]